MSNANEKYTSIPSDEIVKKTADALKANNFTTYIADNRDDAIKKVHELLPSGAEVMVATSETLRELGLEQEINDSRTYKSIKAKLATMDREKDHREMQRIGASAEYQIGSVHAITQDGTVLIASNSGSQLPGYVYGSDHVIWVVGAQKIVESVEDGMTRIKDHITPLESVRARKAYGLPEEWSSYYSKIVLYNREPNPQRVSIVLVKEALGF